MGIISWVQCALREGFVWGGLTLIHVWKSHITRKKFHIKIIYLKLLGEEKKKRKEKNPFTSFLDFLVPILKKKNWHLNIFGIFFFFNYDTFFLQLEYRFGFFDN